MFPAAVQGLSGDVEKAQQLFIEENDSSADTDADAYAHDDGGAVSPAGAVQLSGTDVLSCEAGDGHVKALGRNMGQLFNL